MRQAPEGEGYGDLVPVVGELVGVQLHQEGSGSNGDDGDQRQADGEEGEEPVDVLFGLVPALGEGAHDLRHQHR